jgi:hypothetical protein
MTSPRLSKLLLDYLPPVIAFSAAVVAVVGAPKWNDQATGFAKITHIGWMVLFIGFLALAVSMVVTAKNNREKTQKRQMQERICAAGKAQMLEAVLHSIHPLRNDTIWKRQGRPTSPLDFLDPKRRELLAELNLNSVSPYMSGNFKEIKWHTMFEKAAKAGTKSMVTTLQIFVTYLPFEVIDAATKLLNCTFMQIRLLRMSDLVEANTHHDKNWRVPFFIVRNDEMHNQEYEEFWNLITQAMKLLGAESLPDGRPKFGGY